MLNLIINISILFKIKKRVDNKTYSQHHSNIIYEN